MPKILRDKKQKLECIRKAVVNAQEHIRAGDPRRVYSQYIRYALDEIRNEYFYVSTKAKGLSKNEIIQEHVVPHSIILDKLIALKSLTPKKISDILDRYYAICEITKDENQKLDKKGLRSKMPEGWKDNGLDDRFARYDHVGIKYSKKGEF